MNKISILLPVYNDEKYIEKAIRSVLNNTYNSYELVVINDGSTDSSVSIIESFKDNRIKIYNKSNTGLIDSLNYGLKKCNNDIIMRMDSDDEIKSNKIKVQLNAFLESNSILMGTGAYIIDDESKVTRRINVPVEHKKIINSQNNLTTAIIHPSIMFYKEAIIKSGGYDEQFEVAEDYELFYRIARIGQISNINLPLTLLRKHDQNVSVKKSSKQILNTLVARKVYKNNLSIMKIDQKLYSTTQNEILDSISYNLLNNVTNNIIRTREQKLKNLFFLVMRKMIIICLIILD